MPELRRRLCAEADPAGAGMEAGVKRCAAAAVGQARSSVVQRRRYRRAFGPYQEYSARGALTYNHRHCEERSDEAIQSSFEKAGLLRFARNDGASRPVRIK